MYKFSLLAIILAFTLFSLACSSDQPEQDPSEYSITEAPREAEVSSHTAPSGASLEERVQFYVDHDQYEDALDELRNADSSGGNVMIMKRDTHLHYATWLMNTAVQHGHMADNMPKSLRHFRRVLEIDPDNRQARTNIDQIEGIYRQMGRDVPEGVAE